MTYSAWGCVQRCNLWAWWRKEKGQKLSCFKLAIAQTTHVDIGPWNFARGVVSRKYVFQVSWKSVEGSRSCVGRKSPSAMAYTTAYTTPCTTVQAVMHTKLIIIIIIIIIITRSIIVSEMTKSLQRHYRRFRKQWLKRLVFKCFPKTGIDDADVTFSGSVPQSGSGDQKSSITDGG